MINGRGEIDSDRDGEILIVSPTTLAGNTQDVQTLVHIQEELSARKQRRELNGLRVGLCVMVTLDTWPSRPAWMPRSISWTPARSNASPKARPMRPESILRELAKIQIGDILLVASDGRQLALGRMAQPVPEQARILAALRCSRGLTNNAGHGTVNW